MSNQRLDSTPVLSQSARGGYNLRKPQRLTITVSWSVYQVLLDASDAQGRSLSNLAAYWLERQAQSPRDNPPGAGLKARSDRRDAAAPAPGPRPADRADGSHSPCGRGG